jgi:hypothetical protein
MSPILRPPPPSEDVIERVYLPVAVAIARDRDQRGMAEKKRRAPEHRLFLVERVLGHAWAVACDPVAIVNRDAERASLPARLTTEACRRSIEGLATRTAFVLGRGRVAEPIAFDAVFAASYPFELRYRRGRSGRLDFEALDAITGRRAGGPLRAAIAAALIDADRAAYGREETP